MWDMIVSVPDHCLSFFFATHDGFSCKYEIVFNFLKNDIKLFQQKLHRINSEERSSGSK